MKARYFVLKGLSIFNQIMFSKRMLIVSVVHIPVFGD